MKLKGMIIMTYFECVNEYMERGKVIKDFKKQYGNISASYSRKTDSYIMNMVSNMTIGEFSPSLHRWATTNYDASSIVKKISLPFLIWVTPEWTPERIINGLGLLQSLCYPLDPILHLPALLEVSVGQVYQDFQANLQSVNIQMDSTWLMEDAWLESPNAYNVKTKRPVNEIKNSLSDNSFPLVIHGTMEFVNLNVYARNSLNYQKISLKGMEWKLFSNTANDMKGYSEKGSYGWQGLKDQANATKGNYSYTEAIGITTESGNLKGYLPIQTAKNAPEPDWFLTKHAMKGTEGGMNESLQKALSKVVSGSSIADSIVADNFTPTSVSAKYDKYQIQINEFEDNWNNVYQTSKNMGLNEEFMKQTAQNTNLLMDVTGVIRNVNDRIPTSYNTSSLSNIKYTLQNIKNTTKRIESGSILNELEYTYRRYTNDIKEIQDVFKDF
jgi:hypothetical protein